jgi:hypothetical protein
MRAVIEVCGDDVKFFKPVPDENPEGHTIWAFEPRLEVFEDLFLKSKKFPNYHVVNKAVSSTTGEGQVRLEDFVNEFKIERIDLLHVSTNKGVEVLESLGSQMSIVASGVMKVPFKEGALVESIEFLIKNGFQVYNMKPQDPECKEVLISFYRP